MGDIDITRNGVIVADCTGPTGQAVPTPCVESRQSVGGDAEITVLTVAASTWALVAPAHDSVVMPLKPVKVTIGRGKDTAVKKLSVVVANGDASSSHTLRLTASTSYPGATVTVPDFDEETPASDDTAALAAGKTAKSDGIAHIPARGRRES